MALYDSDESDGENSEVVKRPAQKNVAASPTPIQLARVEEDGHRTSSSSSSSTKVAANPEFAANLRLMQQLNARKRMAPPSVPNLKPVPRPAARPMQVISPATGAVPTPSFLPKTAFDDSLHLFGEIIVHNEYQPACPNDYNQVKKVVMQREASEKAAREVAERITKMQKEEDRKREKGAAIAPPQALLDATPSVSSENPAPYLRPDGGGPAKTGNVFGGTGTAGGGAGLSVAASIMSRMGYREGAGLGRMEQGMNQALKMELTGKGSGVIIHADQQPSTASAAAKPAMSTTELLKNSSKIVVITNMVSPTEVDDELENETREEMTKYGQVVSIRVHVVPDAVPEEAVRLFVEFTNVAQAIKSVIALNSRFFGGRQIRAAFYPCETFQQGDFDAQY